MIEIVESSITSHRLAECGQTIGVAVSGGADSMVLAHILFRLQQTRCFRICVLHFEHGIRGEESVADMQFVQRWCAEREIPCYTERADVPAYAAAAGLNLEDAARRLRYAFFRRCIQEHNLQSVAVAHHADDAAETVLLHLIRGSGPAGLCGLPYRRGDIIRPMLDATRADIEAYAAANGVEYRTDSTNADLSNRRNFVRREVLPRLQALNPRFSEGVLRAGHLLAEEQELLEHYTLQEYAAVAQPGEGRVSIRREAYRLLPPAMRRRILRMALQNCIGSLQDIHSTALYRLDELAVHGGTGKNFALPGVFFAQNSYDLLIIHAKMYTIERIVPVSLAWGQTALPDGSRFSISESTRPPQFPGASSLLQYADADKLPAELQFRPRQPGDTFAPLGMGGSLPLKEWFIDHKVPREAREAPLLYSGSEVLWIPGYALSDRIKIDNTTLQVCSLAYTPAE